KAHVPIDGFGIGTSLTTSSDTPAIDFVYKLQEYSGTPRRKRSHNKATWPGRKQVWRHYDPAGRMASDRISLDNSRWPADRRAVSYRAEALLACVMRDGRRLAPSPSLDHIRSQTKRELERLPEQLRRLAPGVIYPVEIGDDLVELAEDVDTRTRRD